MEAQRESRLRGSRRTQKAERREGQRPRCPLWDKARRDAAPPSAHARPKHIRGCGVPPRLPGGSRFRRTRNPASRDTESAFGLTRKFQVPRQLAHCRASAPPFRTVVAWKRGPRDAARPTLVFQPWGVRRPAAPCRNAGGPRDVARHTLVFQPWGGRRPAAPCRRRRHPASRLSWSRVAPFPLRILREIQFKHHPQPCTKSQNISVGRAVPGEPHC